MCTFTTFSHFIIYFHNPLTSEGKRIKKRGLPRRSQEVRKVNKELEEKGGREERRGEG